MLLSLQTIDREDPEFYIVCNSLFSLPALSLGRSLVQMTCQMFVENLEFGERLEIKESICSKCLKKSKSFDEDVNLMEKLR